MATSLWQRILAWLIKYVWPNVEAILMEKMLDLVKWTFDRIEQFYQERNQAHEKTARQKAEEAEERAEEARQGAETFKDQANKHVAAIEKLKAELERCRIEAELEKQKAVAAVWREVAETIRRDATMHEQGLKTLKEETQAQAQVLVSEVKAEDVFPKEPVGLLGTGDAKDYD
jgi:dsDNA-specific endonuclease/ATPase MutS2